MEFIGLLAIHILYHIQKFDTVWSFFFDSTAKEATKSFNSWSVMIMPFVCYCDYNINLEAKVTSVTNESKTLLEQQIPLMCEDHFDSWQEMD